MNPLRKFLLPVIVAITLTACVNSNESAKNNVEWTGIYTSILPCADCEGIQTTIELKSSQTFEMKVVYLGGEDVLEYMYSGPFTWEKGGNQIKLKIDDAQRSAPNKYIVKENKLIQLDMKGNEITDTNLDYTLGKVSNLINVNWKLIEMNGKKIEIEDEFLKHPQLIINSEYAANGVGICNRFFGKALITGENKIEFPALASTMMACLHMMDVEQEFFATMDKVNKYLVNNNTLNFYSENNELLLTFVVGE